MTLKRAIPSNQPARLPTSGRYRSRERQAARKTSWVASAARSGPSDRRQNENTRLPCRS